MVVLKIFPLEDTEEEHASILPEGEHVIGRGALNCNDKRISRKHAVISVYKDLVTIKAVHVNPCFFKAAKGGGVTILTKDTSVVLNDGDHFAFLSSLFWFKVRITNSDIPMNTSPSTSSASKRDAIEEDSMEISKRQKTSNENVDDAKQINPLTLSASPNILNVPLSVQDNIKTESIDSNILINNLKAIVQEDYGNESKQKSDENSHGSVKVKEELKSEEVENEDKGENPIKLDNSIQIKNNFGSSAESNNVEASILNTTSDQNVVGSIKIEPSVSDAGPSAGQTENVGDLQNKDENHNAVPDGKDDDVQNNIQQNDSNADNNQNKASCSTNDNKTRRERCWYGPTCYRKNPIHRADFSHPGDDDYDTDPDDDRPLCPFGIACYRTNLQHRRQYKHSSRPAPKPSKINLQVNVNNSCPHCPHCSQRSLQKPDYESDYDSDYEY